jgi:hypothetical protein
MTTTQTTTATQEGWQVVTEKTRDERTERLQVPGGWLYRDSVMRKSAIHVTTVFVPEAHPLEGVEEQLKGIRGLLRGPVGVSVLGAEAPATKDPKPALTGIKHPLLTDEG